MAGADHASKVAITGFEDEEGVAWYTIETSSNGPIVRVAVLLKV